MRTAIIEQFEEVLKRYPNSEAVTCGDRKLTIRELSNVAMHIKAAALGSEGGKKRIVAILLPKSVELVAANIAVLASGGAFMNLDCKLPEARIEAILSNVCPDVIITNREYAERYRDTIYTYNPYLIPDDIPIDDEDWSVDVNELIDQDPFCIINTSGSTGTPKAVVLNQKSFYDFMDWVEETYGLDETVKIGSLSPVYFDIYVFELCLLLTKGASISLIDAKYSAVPMELLNKLKVERINFIFWVPTIMVNIANQDLLSMVDLPELKHIWFAGEVFPTKQFNYWYDKLTNAQFTNLYGPIEITLDCTYYIVKARIDENQAIPIGMPCRNTDILILNDNDERCELGETGELCVRGTSLAMGYYNDLERTRKAFVQNPLNTKYPELIYRTGDLVFQKENGEIMFVGRKDSMIKHLGYRIELGEIEHILVNTCKLVKNCCAVYPKNKKEIVLFYEAEDEIDRITFYKELGKIVPKYMIPKVFVRCKQMPQNANGKIDRYALECEAESIKL